MSDGDNSGLVAPDILAAAAADAATASEGATAPAAAALPGAPAVAAPVDHKAEALDLLRFATGLLFPLYPSLEKVYTPAVVAKLADASGPLLAKYGLSMESMLGRFGPEIGFAIVAVPLIKPTVEAIRADRVPPAAAAAAPVKPADPQPIEPAAPVKAPLESKFPGLNADNEQPQPRNRKGKK